MCMLNGKLCGLSLKSLSSVRAVGQILEKAAVPHFTDVLEICTIKICIIKYGRGVGEKYDGC